MSIWSSWETIGYDDISDNPQPHGGEVRSYATGWSNHYPTTDGEVEQRASIDLASIPIWCVPGHDEELDDTIGPWLRLGLNTSDHRRGLPTGAAQFADVVMDEAGVRELHRQLSEWLELPKAHPVVVSHPQDTP